MHAHESKAGIAFDCCDLDHDGFLGTVEIVKVAAAVCDRLGFPAGSPERDRIRVAYDLAWRNALALIDADGDGRISRDEYIGYALSPDSDRAAFLSAVAWPVAEAVFDAVDRDGDERLNRREYLRLWLAFDPEGRGSTWALHMLEGSSDGHLTKDVFARAVYEFYYGEDPATTMPILGRGP
jgi:Ca2+-binding EF-hand superfamily protein